MVANGKAGQVSVVGFGANALPTDGDVVYFDFKVTGREDEETALVPERFRVNEEQPTSPREAAGKIVVPVRGTNGSAVYLPFISGIGTVEHSTDTTTDIHIPMVNR